MSERERDVCSECGDADHGRWRQERVEWARKTFAESTSQVDRVNANNILSYEALLLAAEARAVRCEGVVSERDALLRNMARVAALIINEQKVHTVTTAIVSAGYLAGLAKYANDAANFLLDSRPERPIVEADYGSDL